MAGAAVRAPRGLTPAEALIASYFAAVAVAAIGRAVVVETPVSRLALTPHSFAEGKVWRLVLSGLLVSGPAAPQLVAAAASALVLARRDGAGAFWWVALAGHVGATLLVYAGVGVAWLIDHDAVEPVAFRLDYGISAVWLATLGALVVSIGRPRTPAAAAVSAGCWLAVILGGALFEVLAAAEHVVAFALGALALALLRRRRLRAAR